MKKFSKQIKETKIRETKQKEKKIKETKIREIKETTETTENFFEREIKEFELDIDNIRLETRNINNSYEKIFQKILINLEEEYDLNEDNNKEIYWNITDYNKFKDLYSKTIFKIHKYRRYK